ncbi:YvrJ family protein [Alteribacter natronophilus]|uniref:YvrJ family protein n=1 Tax=Alteribacter natronophilus TaxID=2583810 RepID=UPI00110E062C|nr:YvrJ family protein [Alteribacter natronophilus]TMW71530.1 YvrJ family protein [Alteribacter natronophilus]
METEIWMSVLGDYGFPAAVTFYLLYRMEKKLEQINRSVLLLSRQNPPAPEQPSFPLPPRSSKAYMHDH